MGADPWVQDLGWIQFHLSDPHYKGIREVAAEALAEYLSYPNVETKEIDSLGHAKRAEHALLAFERINIISSDLSGAERWSSFRFDFSKGGFDPQIANFNYTAAVLRAIQLTFYITEYEEGANYEKQFADSFKKSGFSKLIDFRGMPLQSIFEIACDLDKGKLTDGCTMDLNLQKVVRYGSALELLRCVVKDPRLLAYYPGFEFGHQVLQSFLDSQSERLKSFERLGPSCNGILATSRLILQRIISTGCGDLEDESIFKSLKQLSGKKH